MGRMKFWIIGAIVIAVLLGCRSKKELPYDSVDCDNANGNPALCTIEPDEPD